MFEPCLLLLEGNACCPLPLESCLETLSLESLTG
jgi:hypothetical protein